MIFYSAWKELNTFGLTNYVFKHKKRFTSVSFMNVKNNNYLIAKISMGQNILTFSLLLFIDKACYSYRTAKKVSLTT